MKRLALLSLGSLVLALFPRSSADAQVTAAFSQNVEVRVDGEKLDSTNEVLIGTALCQEGVKYEFTLGAYNAPSPINNLEAWASTGANCSTADARKRNTTETPECWLVNDELRGVNDEVKITVDATDIFKASADDTSGECPDLSGNKFTVYFVPLANPTSASPSMPPEPIMGTQYPVRTATFTLYTDPPASPQGVSGKTGESQLEVHWVKATDALTQSTYRVLFDTSPGSDATCAESVLKEGGEVLEPNDATLFETKKVTGTSATLSGLDSKGVALNNYVAAAVIHRDRAGNDSALSEVVCIQRLPTIGFLEACESDPDCKGGFRSCSLSPGARGAAAAGTSLLLALSLVLVARRRHS